MNTNPKISVVVASYNAESTIRRALASVSNQSFKDWECVVVDGLSKDSTVAIANEFAECDPRFRVYSERDKGIYDAFNKGWKYAKGEWIYYLGCDDELYPDGLKHLSECTEGVDFVYGGIARRYASGKIKESLPGYMERCMPYSIAASHQAILMKRSLIGNLGGFDLNYKILADYDLINRAWYEGMHTARTERIIATFQLGGISTDSIASLSERYRILRSYGVPFLSALGHVVWMCCFFMILKVKHKFD